MGAFQHQITAITSLIGNIPLPRLQKIDPTKTQMDSPSMMIVVVKMLWKLASELLATTFLSGSQYRGIDGIACFRCVLWKRLILKGIKDFMAVGCVIGWTRIFRIVRFVEKLLSGNMLEK
jgi:hypothetical protein